MLPSHICGALRRRFWHATHDCVAPYVNIILHRGQFWAKSAASGSVRWWCFRSCWMVLSHVMRGRLSCLLQSAGAEANRILLALSSMHIICPNKVSRRDWMIAVSLGCFVSLRTSSFRTNWYHLMPSSIRRHHWSSASILRASVLDMSVRITIMPTTPTSLLFTSLLSQSTRLTSVKAWTTPGRQVGRVDRSSDGRQSSYFVIQDALQLNVTHSKCSEWLHAHKPQVPYAVDCFAVNVSQALPQVSHI